MEIEDKTASKKIYITDSRHNLLGLDFIKVLGLLYVPINTVCNAVSRFPAHGGVYTCMIVSWPLACICVCVCVHINVDTYLQGKN